MIGIIDYNMGNLGSVQNACAFLGLPHRIVRAPAELDDCRAAILPGVGAFRDCMQHLDDHGFAEAVPRWIEEGKPFLGICLGLQVLFEDSEENPGCAGLGILPGRVRRFSPDLGLKVPQIGWNSILQKGREIPLFDDIEDGSFCYFVHSYYVDCADADALAGETEYGIRYTSAVWRDNLAAVQFHPEKSQRVGLTMLRNFSRHFKITEG